MMDFFDHRYGGPMAIRNMPWYFTLLMKAAASWIPESIMKKLLVIKDVSSLHEALPLSKIPREFGGQSDYDMDAFLRWREEVEGVSSDAPPSHKVNMRLLRISHKMEAVRRGFGYKKTRSNRWKKYYFVLDEGILFYYKNKKARTSNNGIMLETSIVHSGEE
ncbi:hypothetical protein KIPB_009103, partial [Kipferlia bialata]|eukprot:g9103.t1